MLANGIVQYSSGVPLTRILYACTGMDAFSEFHSYIKVYCQDYGESVVLVTVLATLRCSLLQSLYAKISNRTL